MNPYSIYSNIPYKEEELDSSGGSCPLSIALLSELR